VVDLYAELHHVMGRPRSLERAALARFSSGHLPRERLNSILGTIRDRLPRGWDRS
jgi:hypothetical protein